MVTVPLLLKPTSENTELPPPPDFFDSPRQLNTQWSAGPPALAQATSPRRSIVALLVGLAPFWIDTLPSVGISVPSFGSLRASCKTTLPATVHLPPVPIWGVPVPVIMPPSQFNVPLKGRVSAPERLEPVLSKTPPPAVWSPEICSVAEPTRRCPPEAMSPVTVKTEGAWRPSAVSKRWPAPVRPPASAPLRCNCRKVPLCWNFEVGDQQPV